MKTIILITDISLTFDKLESILKNNFVCYRAIEDRLTVEEGSKHLFIDFDDEMQNDYVTPVFRGSNKHFYAVLYHSDELVRKVLMLLKEYPISIDDDNDTILPIKEFLTK